jgi:hypothetical protein
MDADDVSHPDRLSQQLRFLQEHPEVGVVGTQVKGFPSRTLGDGYRRYVAWLNALLTPEQIEREIFVESPLAHPSVLMRRSVVEVLGGYQAVEGPEDYDLWLRCFPGRDTDGQCPPGALLLAGSIHQALPERPPLSPQPILETQVRLSRFILEPAGGRYGQTDICLGTAAGRDTGPQAFAGGDTTERVREHQSTKAG